MYVVVSALLTQYLCTYTTHLLLCTCLCVGVNLTSDDYIQLWSIYKPVAKLGVGIVEVEVHVNLPSTREPTSWVKKKKCQLASSFFFMLPVN